MNKTLNTNNLKRGDVLSVKRKLGYKHFGVYAGNGKVIHFSGSKKGELNPSEADIIKTDLEYFTRGDEFRVENKQKRFNGDLIVRRAEAKKGKLKGSYNLVTNNCEHFARWCETGEKKSDQVDKVVHVVIGRFGRMLEKRIELRQINFMYE